MREGLVLMALFGAGAACAETPSRPIHALERPSLPSLEGPQKDAEAALATKAAFAEAMQKVEARQLVFARDAQHVSFAGRFSQGGLVFGQTLPNSRVTLDGAEIMVGDDGRFLLGFGRDAALSALVVVTLPDGAVERIGLEIEDRDFPVERIDGLPDSQVSEFTEEQLKKIAADTEKKKGARSETHSLADWANGFDWPVTGRVSGVFGSQRILNGKPKTPHSGLDVAAPAGTPIKAPADGIVRLADPEMYFEGGLVFIDHGHWLESAIMHMSRLDVAPGQKVAKGEVIGAVGSTGRATGPHMHWSVRWAGELVDPQLLLLPAASSAPAAGEAAPE